MRAAVEPPLMRDIEIIELRFDLLCHDQLLVVVANVNEDLWTRGRRDRPDPAPKPGIVLLQDRQRMESYSAE